MDENTEPTTPTEPTPEEQVPLVGIDVAESMFLDFGNGIKDQFVIAGGTMGQALAKASNADFDLTWQDVAVEGTLPPGGTSGQVLAKAGEIDYDTTWATLEELGVPMVPPTAIFNANSGKFAATNKSVEIIEQINGAAIVFPEINPVKVGHDFSGWFLHADGTGDQVNSETLVDWIKGKTFYAKWTVQTYNITLSNNYTGAPAGTQTTVTYGSMLSAVTPPTRSGYTFLGYYTASAGGNMVIDSTGRPLSAWTTPEVTTIYAHWKRNDIVGGDSLETLTWDNLNNMTSDATEHPEDYAYLLGQTKPVTIAGYGTFDFMLIGIAHDDWTDGSGKAAFTFMCTSCITTRAMNANTSTTGGWGGAELHTWLNNTLLPALDEDLVASIRQVKKKYTVSTEDRQTMYESNDSLFLASPMELFGTNEAGLEGSQYQYMAEQGTASHKLTLNGNPSSYYLRSVYDAGSFYSVDENGALSHAEATSALGIAPCFCVGNLFSAVDATVARLDSVWGQDEMWSIIDEVGDQVRMFPTMFDQFVGRDITVQHDTLGAIKFTVMDVAHEDRTDGKGKAAFTLMAINGAGTMTPSSGAPNAKTFSKTTATPTPWSNVDAIYNHLSSLVASKIVEVTILEPSAYNGTSSAMDPGFGDEYVSKKTWLPSVGELYPAIMYMADTEVGVAVARTYFTNGRRIGAPFQYYLDRDFETSASSWMSRDITSEYWNNNGQPRWVVNNTINQYPREISLLACFCIG